MFLLDSSGLEQIFLRGIWGPLEPIPTEFYRNLDCSSYLALEGQKFPECAKRLTYRKPPRLGIQTLHRNCLNFSILYQ